jgi:raffinose/stachyose/melibiose transport system permease protein
MKKLERRNLPWIYLFLLPTLILFGLFFCWPIIQVVGTSFTRWNGFSTPVWVGVDNYRRLFSMSSFTVSLRNIGLWSLIAMTLHVGFGVLVALIFFRQPRGWKLARAAFMVPMVISGAAWAMIYRFVFNNEFGILNNLIRVFNPDFNVNWFFQTPAAFWAITFTWLFYAVIISMVVLADLMAIPTEIHEAAKIDGASGWQALWLIELPLCRFSIGTSMIMAITSRISMFEAIALTSRGGPGNTTMSLSLILVRNITDRNYGVANATAVVMFAMGIGVLLIISRLFRMSESVY